MQQIYGVPKGACADDSTMIRIIRICRKCGAKILSDAPEGLCGRCVLKAALGNFTETPVPAGAGCGSVENRKANATAVAADTKKLTHAAELLGELGDYELIEEIGRGGQGVVFRARQKSLNRIVALKVISLGQWASKAHLKRFRLEAEAAARLEHPGIVPIHEVGERDGSCYFSMKFVEGGQLDELARRESMPIRRAVELIGKVARTVDYAHEHGILHRDIKPGNILLDAKGEPHLTDFGLARLVESESSITQTLDVLGTPSYMAPEQAVGNNAAVSNTTDVYGIGAVLYQLVTGHPPFAGGTTYETIKLLLESEPRAPRLLNRRIDRDLSTICLKCLEKHPQRRYSSALALAEDLERWLKHQPIAARRTGLLIRGVKWTRRNPTTALLATALVALVGVLGWNVWKNQQVPMPTGIAVLPFDNLDGNKENSAFVDGLQDDILTKLAKIAELKVISRTSVMEYRGNQNVRRIGEALRVSHVLEGSARKTGDRIHLNAQLIDTRTDTHVWAEQYDRNLNDLFAIQSEIAQKVAAQLRAKLSATEKLAIERRPTADVVAFDLYSRASDLYTARTSDKTEYLQAIELLNRAVARDPSFFEAYCKLALIHDVLYFEPNQKDHTATRLAMAQEAIDAAFRLKPDSGEAHLALAVHLYRGYSDYKGAMAELEVARQSLPNEARIFQMMGFIQRRQGRWEESIRNLERAAELDPRDMDTLYAISDVYEALGGITEARSWLIRAANAAEPSDAFAQLALADLEWNVNADPRPAHQAIATIRATNAVAMKSAIARYWFIYALSERDAAAAREALDALDDDRGISLLPQVVAPRAFSEGVIARMEKDQQKAQLAFATALAEQEKVVEAHPDDASARCVLGMIDAGLGRKEDALREGSRAVELLPREKDAIVGGSMIRGLAIIAAWVGEKDRACEQLAIGARPPRFVNYGNLKLMPTWDPLRGYARFEKIVASLAPRKRSDR